MNNVLETNGVPLTVFGGAVPEMAPEDLPEGASPWNQDCDYTPGAVFTRGGRQNQYVLANLSVSKLPAFAASVPGANAPNEIAWSSPTNVELGTPGTYASTTLAHSGSFTGALGPYIDAFNSNSGTQTVPLSLSTSANDFVAYFTAGQLNPSWVAPPAGFTDTGVGGASQVAYGNFPAGSNVNISPHTVGSVAVAGIMIAIPTTGSASITAIGSGSGGGGVINCFSSVAIAATDVLIALVSSGEIFSNSPPISAPTDTQNNPWLLVGIKQDAGNAVYVAVYMCVAPNPIGAGANNVTYSVTFPNSADNGLVIFKAANLTTLPAAQGFSQILEANSFGFSIPNTQSILGMQIEIDGHQSTADPSAFVNVTIGNPSTPATPTFKAQLPAADGPTLFGTPTTNWGVPLTPALVDSPTLQVNVVAQSAVNATFFVYGIRLKIFFASNPANINWLKTYEQTDAEVDTLVLDANGVLWDEDVDTNPGTLNGIFTGILANTFAKSVTFQDIEYIAFSNLLNGTDIPRQWNGTNLDRISMVGPGAPCSATAQAAGNTIVSITQAPATQIRRIAWGASSNAINDSTPGNVLVVFGEGRTGSNTFASLPNAVAGGTIVLSGLPSTFPLKGGGSLPYNLNGTYTILQVTTAIVGGNEVCPVFLIQAPATAYGYSQDFGTGGPPPVSGWFYQATLATMTTSTPVPNLNVGNQFQIAGTGGAPTAGYDGTWTVVGELNGAQLQINSTQLTSGIASYAYTLISGTAPAAGQLVTVTGTLNGGGIFNVSQVQITAASPGSFSVAIPKPDVTVAAETGQGIIFGTQFTFDPLLLVGTKNGGTIVSSGQIGVGVRKVCYSYLTRSGFITQPSPIFTFNVVGGSQQILVTGVLPGPPNVVARIIHLTGANGGNFFNIPQPVTVISNGAPIVNTSTYINDNTTTSILLSFADGVLLSGTAIDIPGNNLFSDIELGSSRGVVSFASRLFAWSEQNKVTNLRNLSFDGGILGATVQGVTTTYPAGWTVDPNLGAGASVVASPVFGFAYQIQNSSGLTQSTYGMITQPAYQDEFLVPIINAAVLYSVRVTASCPSGAASGNLVVDLFSPKFGASYPGLFTIPLASMSPTMQIFTGTLLVPAIAPVPSDLVIRIYAQNIPTGVTVQLDRCEPFPTATPVLTTQLKGSYVNNQEAFDLVTGATGPNQNQQPINGGMLLFDRLHALKERSWYSTFDDGVNEPNQWKWKEESAKTGTIGIHSYDFGEGWALTGNRQGVFFYEGGEPIKVSQEIQPLWDLVNWKYGHTMWVRNDPEQKRFTIGVPIPTPNPFMPEFPANPNPTSPNVVLMCNYRELNTGAMMASTPPIKATYTGRIMAPEPARKWSFWNIASPYSDYIDRADNTWPQFFASGYGDSKVFALSASALSDDGQAINSFYITYGFVKPETADAKGLGLFRMEVPYMTILAVGQGTLASFVYPESPQNLPFALDPLTLGPISQGDLEVPVNVKGQRFFIRFGTNAVGSTWRVSKIVLPLMPDTWSPIRGTMAGSV